MGATAAVVIGIYVATVNIEAYANLVVVTFPVKDVAVVVYDD